MGLHQPGRNVQFRDAVTASKPLRSAVAALALPLLLWGCGANAVAGTSRSAEAPCKAWQYAASPKMIDSEFGGVSGVTSADVWSVGNIYDLYPLIEHWDGSAWSQVPQPMRYGLLEGVAALAGDDAWAVGKVSYVGFLIEHWDGSAWSRVHVPPNPESELASISALSTTDIWAAGNYRADNGSIQPLYEHWDGRAWRQVPEASGTEDNGGKIYGLYGRTATDVWAVGYQGTPVFPQVDPLIEHWNGTAWSVVPAASLSDQGVNQLTAVYASAADDAWAVGITSDGGFMQHWDGSTWTLTEEVDGAQYFALSGTGPEDVWAVGHFEIAPLTKHWDGKVWTRQRAPMKGDVTALADVASLSSSEVWTVGVYYPTGEGSPTPAAFRSRGPCS
jgi:hypothetical protein